MTASTLTTRSALGVAALVATALAAGCEKEQGGDVVDPLDPTMLAEDGTDAAAVETDAELVTSSLVSGTTTNGTLTLASTGDLTTSDAAGRALGDGARAVYFPRGCLTVTPDEAARTVAYAFDGCSGPNGIFRITGLVTVTYRTAPGQLVLDLVGTGLRINRATVDWSAHAEITATGATRQMTWKGQLQGTTARGRELSRSNEKVLAWRFGERCFSVSGVSEGDVKKRRLRTEVTGFRRCQGSCPEAGGKITITDRTRDKSVVIDFDGTSEATYTNAKGERVRFPLACQG